MDWKLLIFTVLLGAFLFLGHGGPSVQPPPQVEEPGVTVLTTGHELWTGKCFKESFTLDLKVENGLLAANLSGKLTFEGDWHTYAVSGHRAFEMMRLDWRTDAGAFHMLLIKDGANWIGARIMKTPGEQWESHTWPFCELTPKEPKEE